MTKYEGEGTSHSAESRAVEQCDDTLRRARKLAERRYDWLSISEGRLAEAYLKGEMNIAARTCGDARQWGAVFQIAPVVDDAGRIVARATADKRNGSRKDGCAKQLAVLTDKVKLVEGEEKVIPSLVRPQLFDSRFVGIREPFYFFYRGAIPVLPDVESVSGLGNWEIRAFGPYEAVPRGERDGKDVEAAPHHMQDCSSFGLDDAGQRLNEFCLDDFLARIASIRLERGDVWIVAAPSNNAGLQDLDLGYGPINCRLSV